jgi:hypothetical protein
MAARLRSGGYPSKDAAERAGAEPFGSSWRPLSASELLSDEHYAPSGTTMHRRQHREVA